MKQPPKLEVTPFENRNGTISYRVVGWINDERVRKNFKTRAEANAEKTALEIGAVQAANGMQMFVAKFRSVGEAAIQAGNSESIIKSHYLDVKSAEEAEEFFGIMPKHTAQPMASITLHPASRAALRKAS